MVLMGIRKLIRDIKELPIKRKRIAEAIRKTKELYEKDFGKFPSPDELIRYLTEAQRTEGEPLGVSEFKKRYPLRNAVHYMGSALKKMNLGKEYNPERPVRLLKELMEHPIKTYRELREARRIASLVSIADLEAAAAGDIHKCWQLRGLGTPEKRRELANRSLVIPRY